jgi:hypothetical protein
MNLRKFIMQLSQNNARTPTPTDRMRAPGFQVHVEERNRYERTIASQTKDSVPKFDSCMMLFRVPLVKIYICRTCSLESMGTSAALTKMPLPESFMLVSLLELFGRKKE